MATDAFLCPWLVNRLMLIIRTQHLASVVTMLVVWKGLKLPSSHLPSVLLSPVLCSCDLTCRPTEREREGILKFLKVSNVDYLKLSHLRGEVTEREVDGENCYHWFGEDRGECQSLAQHSSSGVCV